MKGDSQWRAFTTAHEMPREVIIPLILLVLCPSYASCAVTCPNGWSAAPSISSSRRCLGIPAGRASSLRGCMELCGAQGATPACIISVEENALAAELLAASPFASLWLGLYQNDTGGGPREGWGRCAGGDASGLAFWARDVKNPR